MQAEALIPLLHAFGVARVVTSTSTRCVQTVQPYAADQVLPLTEIDELSEEGFDEAAARTLLSELLSASESSVLCSHRPALPQLLEILGIEEEPLAPARARRVPPPQGCGRRHRTALPHAASPLTSALSQHCSMGLL